MTVAIIRVTDEDDRTSIGEAITNLNDRAKRISRRGKVGLLSPDYATEHERINALLVDYEAAPTRENP